MSYAHAPTFADLARPADARSALVYDGALAAGLWPFVPGDLLKQVLAALLLPGAWRLVRRD